ncbi:hypothetical protein HDG40_000769 [Paraburkholderia sp. JPY158]|uniref:Uncharacterized protein n=1 Tax=Paraburkholderia atlantica TaxID=2654982 RepID=A0A7W8Q3E9_PARAM|nr:hypothetical protein [Paraburkholderia atlantica]
MKRSDRNHSRNPPSIELDAPAPSIIALKAKIPDLIPNLQRTTAIPPFSRRICVAENRRFGADAQRCDGQSTRLAGTPGTLNDRRECSRAKMGTSATLLERRVTLPIVLGRRMNADTPTARIFVYLDMSVRMKDEGHRSEADLNVSTINLRPALDEGSYLGFSQHHIPTARHKISCTLKVNVVGYRDPESSGRFDEVVGAHFLDGRVANPLRSPNPSILIRSTLIVFNFSKKR